MNESSFPDQIVVQWRIAKQNWFLQMRHRNAFVNHILVLAEAFFKDSLSICHFRIVNFRFLNTKTVFTQQNYISHTQYAQQVQTKYEAKLCKSKVRSSFSSQCRSSFLSQLQGCRDAVGYTHLSSNSIKAVNYLLSLVHILVQCRYSHTDFE